MKRVIIILTLAIFLLGVAPVAAIEKVPKKSNQSTTIQNKDSSEQKKSPSAKKDVPKKTVKKDTFIDRDGDGINDKVTKSKPPEIKKPVVKPRSKPAKRKTTKNAPKTEEKREEEKKSKK